MKRLINNIQKNIERQQLERLSPLEITFISKLQSNDLNIDSIKELLEQGVDPNIKHPFLHTIISNVIKRENGYEILDLLLQYKLDPNLSDLVKKHSLLHTAVDIMNIKIIEKLLQYNASINILNYKSQTPLFRAIFNIIQKNINDKLYLPVIQLLLENNANPNLTNHDKISPLHLVAVSNMVDIAKLLLKFNVFVHILDGEGNTPLMYACVENNIEIVKLLLPLSYGKHFLSAFKSAIQYQHFDIIKLFFESYNFTELDKPDVLELIISIIDNFLESLTDEDLNILEWLISYIGINYFKSIIQNYKYILTELIYIYSSGVNKLNFLIDLGISVDTIDPNTGNTSLIISAKNHYTSIEIVKSLIEHSNDKNKLINTENIQGETPLILFTNFSDDIIKYLIDNGGDINYTNKFGETFFMHACISSFDITYLINKGANINHKSLTEETPLIWAIKDSNEKNVQILLENYAEVTNNIFSIALEIGNASILRLLSEYIIDNNIDIDPKYQNSISQYTSDNIFKWEDACKTKDKYEIQKYKNLFNINESNIENICVQLNNIQKDMIDYKYKNINKCINTDNLDGYDINDISPESFYSFKQNDITYCEDINTLFKVLKSYKKRQPPKQAENPYTGKQIPNDIIIDIEEKYARYNQISTGKKNKDNVYGPTFKDLLLSQLIMFYNIIKNLTLKEIFISSSEIQIKKFIEELLTLKINDKHIFETLDFEKISLNQDLDHVKYLLIQLLLSKIVIDKYKYTENNVIVYPTRESIQTLWNKIFN
jgi:ankyrin repeat protein